jgi:membrane fusion protein (multidrug efflux system)
MPSDCNLTFWMGRDAVDTAGGSALPALRMFPVDRSGLSAYRAPRSHANIRAGGKPGVGQKRGQLEHSRRQEVKHPRRRPALHRKKRRGVVKAQRHSWLALLVCLPSPLLHGCDNPQLQAKAELPPAAVTVVPVAEDKITPTVTFTGRVQAQDKVDLRARIDGFLEKRLFNEGQDVKKGDVLFVIEQAPYKSAIAEIKAEIVKAQATLTLADIEVRRATELLAKEVGTQKRLDDVTMQQARARGEIARLKASLEKAELNLSYTEIRAPLAGRIGRATVSVGNYVGPSSEPLATIVRQDPIYVSFPVTQREMLQVRKDRKSGDADATIYVRLADGSRYAQAGKVDFVDVTVSQGTDTVQVRASFPNPNRILVDGQLVAVVAEVGKPQPALLIPQQALQMDQAGPFVLVVDDDNKVEVRRIEVGPAPGAQVSVAKGLKAGERIITEGVQKVRPGDAVQTTEVKA